MGEVEPDGVTAEAIQYVDESLQDTIYDLPLSSEQDWDNVSKSIEWRIDLPDLTHLFPNDCMEHDGESNLNVRSSHSHHRRLRKHKIRSYRSLRNSTQESSASVSPYPVNALSLALLGPWARFEELDTWQYCANVILSYIPLYAQTGFLPMMAPAGSLGRTLDPVLRRALGICAAHETLAETQGYFFQELLESEIQELIASSASASASCGEIMANQNSVESVLREQATRLQALILYQIMLLFSDKARDFHKARAHEALFASWTRELQLQVYLLEQVSTSDVGTAHVGPTTEPARSELLDTAYRTILMSYELRAVHSVLNYKTCPVWNDIFTIAVPPSLSGAGTLLYPDYITEWEKGTTPVVGECDAQFRNLLVAACKGIGVVQRTTS